MKLHCKVTLSLNQKNKTIYLLKVNFHFLLIAMCIKISGKKNDSMFNDSLAGPKFHTPGLVPLNLNNVKLL